jgi:acetyl esterase
MQLHPQMKAILDQAAASGAKPFHAMTPAEARQGIAALLEPFNSAPEKVAKSEKRTIPGPGGQIPVQIYTPEGNAPFPVLVYFHGGGWTVGTIESWDSFCRSLCNASGCVTVSVDYRLAPEHKFPAGPEDCYAATDWVAKNAASIGGDPARVAVGGDSAGGNLAAVAALMARDQDGPALCFQLLIYPAFDPAMSAPSHQEFAQDGYVLSRADMAWFWNHYLRGPQDEANPYLNPARAKDLSRLPAALVITAGFDPLRDEGEAYATMLRTAGVPVTSKRYAGLTHGFFNMTSQIEQARVARDEASARLREALARG